MEVRAGYKQTEVGVIPIECDAKEVGSELALLTGLPFPSIGYAESGVRLLRGSNVKRGQTDWGDDITRQRTEMAINAELSGLYWRVGQRIHREILSSRRAGYGEKERMQPLPFERSALSNKPDETIRHDLDVLRQEQHPSPDPLLKDPYPTWLEARAELNELPLAAEVWSAR